MTNQQQYNARKDPRRGRNVAIGVSIGAFMIIVFAVSIIKMQGLG